MSERRPNDLPLQLEYEDDRRVNRQSGTDCTTVRQVTDRESDKVLMYSCQAPHGRLLSATLSSHQPPKLPSSADYLEASAAEITQDSSSPRQEQAPPVSPLHQQRVPKAHQRPISPPPDQTWWSQPSTENEDKWKRALQEEAERRAREMAIKTPIFPWQRAMRMSSGELHVNVVLVETETVAVVWREARRNSTRCASIPSRAMQSEDAITNIASYFDQQVPKFDNNTPVQVNSPANTCAKPTQVASDAGSVVTTTAADTVREMTASVDSGLEKDQSGQFVPSPVPCSVRVGIYGAASIGKSHMCQRLLINWARKRQLRSFPIVFLFKLRDEATQKADSLKSLLMALGLPAELAKGVSPVLERLRGRGCLLVFDGLDELQGHGSHYLKKVLTGQALPEACLLVTSRACTEGEQLFLNYAYQLEVLGFNDLQADEFIRRQLPDAYGSLADQLIKQKKEDPHLAALTQNPLMASVICEVFQQRKKLPHTKAELYEQIILAMFRVAVQQKRLHIDNSHVDFNTLQQLREQAHALLSKITRLALETYRQSMVTFDGRVLLEHKCSEQESPEVHALGLLTSTVTRPDQITIHSVHYYAFSHQTLQEYLAAYEMTSCLTDETAPCGKHQPIHDAAQTASQANGSAAAVTANAKTTWQKRWYWPGSAVASAMRKGVSVMTGRTRAARARAQASCPLQHMLELVPLNKKNFLVWQFVAGMIPHQYGPCLAAILAEALKTSLPRDQSIMTLQARSCLMECFSKRDYRHPLPESFKLPEELVLSRIRLTKYDMQAVCCTIEAAKNIEVLYMAHCSLDSQMALCLSEGLLMVAGLRELYISGNQIGDNGLVALSEAVLPHNVIQNMDVANNNLTPACCERFAQQLRRNTSLKRLHMQHNDKLGDNGVAEILRALASQRKPGIIELGLRETGMGDMACKYLAHILANPEGKLERLRLSNNPITSNGAYALHYGLVRNKSLTTLKLDRTQVGNAGVQMLSQALLFNKTMTGLFISMTAFSESGAIELAKGLEHNSTLTKLDVSENSIGTQAAQRLAKSILDHSKLRWVNLSGEAANAIQDQFKQQRRGELLIHPQVKQPRSDDRPTQDTRAHCKLAAAKSVASD